MCAACLARATSELEASLAATSGSSPPEATAEEPVGSKPMPNGPRDP
jgi:hypothetical protein